MKKRVYLNEEEAQTILEMCDSLIQCEADSAKDYEEDKEWFKMHERSWRSLKRKIKEAGVRV